MFTDGKVPSSTTISCAVAMTSRATPGRRRPVGLPPGASRDAVAGPAPGGPVYRLARSAAGSVRGGGVTRQRLTGRPVTPGAYPALLGRMTPRSSSAARCPRPASRAPISTVWPISSSRRAVSRPRPLFAPVIRVMVMAPSITGPLSQDRRGRQRGKVQQWSPCNSAGNSWHPATIRPPTRRGARGH